MSGLGIALSGGGHRATMWSIGALLYLTEVGKNQQVRAISSVSGGSIANGVLAQKTTFDHEELASLKKALRPLARHCANEGLFFWGRRTNGYVISMFTSALLGVVALAASGWAIPAPIGVGVGILLLVLALGLFGVRSRVVDRALDKQHFCGAQLGAEKGSVDHVWCATEVQSGDHLYFGRNFVYSYRFGLGKPGNLRLSTAVQASACFPGAFALRRLSTEQHKFDLATDKPVPTKMVLADGGVYDNMAEQWLIGLPRRLDRTDGLAARLAGSAFDDIIVVNASAGWVWRRFTTAWIPLLGEVLSLVRTAHVMHDVTTTRRRVALVNPTADMPRTALVHIGQSPYTVPDKFGPSSEFGGRAEEALEWLGDTEESRTKWSQIVDRNTAVPTVLRKLGRQAALELVYHSYALAAVNLHVLLDYPLPTRSLATFEQELREWFAG